MPELPEVETTLKGIEPHIIHQKITKVTIRHFGLRWPIEANIEDILTHQLIDHLERRGKYLLFKTSKGTLFLHLGMSGRLRIVTEQTPVQKHDHVDIEFGNHKILRFTDPRRFGAFLWTQEDPAQHALLKHLGPEPLSHDFSGRYLWEKARGRKVAIKAFIMDSKIVVGVGNIYATEALFAAGINPKLAAGKISESRYESLVNEIKKILRSAIKQGGTTLKDFVNSEGKPGYFKFHLKAYGRKGLACVNCGTKLKEIRLGQRSTVYCPACQK
ncbi:MAG: bifunctional DNA-formamidopyrimidine glycosylase/DNA-(apurinic or apyrimidinic site) lyase [Gammaproteobacteria bacterium]